MTFIFLYTYTSRWKYIHKYYNFNIWGKVLRIINRNVARVLVNIVSTKMGDDISNQNGDSVHVRKMTTTLQNQGAELELKFWYWKWTWNSMDVWNLTWSVLIFFTNFVPVPRLKLLLSLSANQNPVGFKGVTLIRLPWKQDIAWHWGLSVRRGRIKFKPS